MGNSDSQLCHGVGYNEVIEQYQYTIPADEVDQERPSTG